MTPITPIRRPSPADCQRTKCDAGRPVAATPRWQGTFSAATPGGPEKARQSTPAMCGHLFTTPAHGTIHAPGHDFWPVANASRNGIRLAQWRDRLQPRDADTGSPEVRHGSYSRPSGREVLRESLRGFALAVFFVFAATVVMALGKAKPRPVEVECVHQWTADARYVERCE